MFLDLWRFYYLLLGKILWEKSPTVPNETASSPFIPGKWTFLLQQCRGLLRMDKKMEGSEENEGKRDVDKEDGRIVIDESAKNNDAVK